MSSLRKKGSKPHMEKSPAWASSPGSVASVRCGLEDQRDLTLGGLRATGSRDYSWRVHIQTNRPQDRAQRWKFDTQTNRREGRGWQVLGGEDPRSYYIIGIVSLLLDGGVLEMDDGYGLRTIWKYLILLSYTLKNSSNIKFYVAYILLQFKKWKKESIWVIPEGDLLTSLMQGAWGTESVGTFSREKKVYLVGAIFLAFSLPSWSDAGRCLTPSVYTLLPIVVLPQRPLPTCPVQMAHPKRLIWRGLQRGSPPTTVRTRCLTDKEFKWVVIKGSPELGKESI